MSSENSELIAWCRSQREEALRQTDLFAPGGVKALLQMPDGTTQDITNGVVKHQAQNIAMFERLMSALAR